MKLFLQVFGVVFLLFLGCVDAGLKLKEGEKPPPTCCAPDQYEAHLQSTGNNFRTGLAVQDYNIRVSYDYTNERWAFHSVDPEGFGNDTRIVFDHKNNVKAVIRPDLCVRAKARSEMQPQCVPSNATYHGYFEYGMGEKTLGYDMWSWEFVLFPLRGMMKVSREHCMPIQEGFYGLVANNWAWYEPEPPCVPWASFPVVKEAAKGLCTKCYQQRMVKKRGTQLTGLQASGVFTDVSLGISDESMFEIPEDCKKVKEWSEDIKYDMTTRYFIMRFHQDRTFEDDPNF